MRLPFHAASRVRARERASHGGATFLGLGSRGEVHHGLLASVAGSRPSTLPSASQTGSGNESTLYAPFTATKTEFEEKINAGGGTAAR